MAHNFKDFPELTNSQMQFYYFESPHKQITEDFTAKVVNVHDGDTITVMCDFRKFKFPIRMAYIGAPELDEAGGIESQKWLESEILNEEVDIKINKDNRVGKWGRLIGTIIYQGRNLNQASQDEGFSIPFEDIGKLWGNF